MSKKQKTLRSTKVDLPKLSLNLLKEIFKCLELAEQACLSRVSSFTHRAVSEIWNSTQALDLSEFPGISYQELSVILRKCPKLKSLKATCFNLKLSSLKLLQDNLSELRLMRADKLIENGHFLTELKRFVNLDTLELSWKKHSPSTAEWKEYLESRHWKELSLRGSNYTWPRVEAQVLKCNSMPVWLAPGLQEFRFEGNSGNYSALETLESLTKLRIKEFCPVADLRFLQTNRNLKNLTVLKLSFFYESATKRVDELLLMTLANSCSSLQKLSLDGFKHLKDASLLEFIACSPQIKSISLKYTHLTDDSLFELAKLPQLKKVTLKGCKRITQRGLCELVKAKLSYLNLSHVRGVTDKVTCCLDSPQNLYLENTQISDLSLRGLGSLSQLKVLCLNNCKNILESSSYLHLRNLKGLKKLFIQHAKYLLGPDFVSIIQTLGRQLTELDITGCFLLDSNSINQIPQNCRSLKNLVMKNFDLEITTLVDLCINNRNLFYVSITKLTGAMPERVRNPFKIMLETLEGVRLFKYKSD